MGLATSQTLEPPPLYQTRNARATALYQLLEAYDEDVKSVWEERFERRNRDRALVMKIGLPIKAALRVVPPASQPTVTGRQPTLTLSPPSPNATKLRPFGAHQHKSSAPMSTPVDDFHQALR